MPLKGGSINPVAPCVPLFALRKPGSLWSVESDFGQIEVSDYNPDTSVSIRLTRFCDWINAPEMIIKYCVTGVRFYNVPMTNSSEILNAVNRDSSSVTAICELTSHPVAVSTRCLWCGRAFTPRVTGGSAQKFCSTGHRQKFWIAARRWTMRAIDAGLLRSIA